MNAFGDLRNSETAAGQVFSLPIEPLQKQDDTESIIEAFRDLSKTAVLA